MGTGDLGTYSEVLQKQIIRLVALSLVPGYHSGPASRDHLPKACTVGDTWHLLGFEEPDASDTQSQQFPGTGLWH